MIPHASSKLCDHESLTQLLNIACAMEVMSPKPGNVAPGQEFGDSSVDDFLRSARAIAPVLATAETQTLGSSILGAVRATRTVVNHNTNLGIILLLAPLATVRRDYSLEAGISKVLQSTTVEDSRLVYDAIRLAQPAGLGAAGEQDVGHEPTLNLIECMTLAAERDMIAAQYANGFRQVLQSGRDWLQDSLAVSLPQPQRIRLLAVRFIAAFGDSLIARKCGQEMCDMVREKARQLLQEGWPMLPDTSSRYAEFDTFLRAEGNRRNPGTTADLIAAVLFAGLRDGYVVPEGNWFERKGSK
ncbi:MAG: triphosphoribosyl-dephospho-CoA synthase [Planctomycetaceae bacterium]